VEAMLVPYLLLLLVLLLVTVHHVDGGTAGIPNNSILYVIGAAKEVSQYLPKVKKNIYAITKLFSTYKVVVYSDSTSFPALQEWKKKDDKVHILQENFKHPSRTYRLAHGRNLLVEHIHSEAKANKQQSIENSYVLMIDFDDVNTPPFNMTTVSGALARSSEWDVVSFNRVYYYDIWALRYDRFNVNIWNFGTQSHLLRDVIEADLISLLNPAEPHLFPVYSAFNGVAFYKLKATTGCTYNGANSETFFAGVTMYNHSRATIPEECEHVAFHRCLGSKNNARLRIYSGPIV
jgi:hypothetical protein